MLGGITHPYKFTIPITSDLNYTIKFRNDSFTYEEAQNGIVIGHNSKWIVGFNCCMYNDQYPLYYIWSIYNELLLYSQSNRVISMPKIITDDSGNSVAASRISYDEVILDAEWIFHIDPYPKAKYLYSIAYMDDYLTAN